MIPGLARGSQFDHLEQDPQSGAINTKGAWLQQVASLAHEYAGLWIHNTVNGSANTGLFDLGIGGVGSEQVVIANILVCGAGARMVRTDSYFPLRLPKGQALTARWQCSAASQFLEPHITLVRAGPLWIPGYGRATTYGAVTATSSGVTVDPGAVASTKGAYAQIVAATTFPIKALMMFVSNRGNTVMTSTSWDVDIAVGAAGSEQILVPSQVIYGTANDDTIYPGSFGPFPVDLPAGVRLAIRSSCGITDATDRLLDMTLIGFD